eukprot:42353_1
MAILILLFIDILWFSCICCSNNDDHAHAHGNKMHKCSGHHDNIVKGVNLFQQEIHYNNHPYSPEFTLTRHNEEQEDRRSLLSQSQVSPIRISAYYDPITINPLRDTQQTYIKRLIGAVTEYYAKIVSVVPVDGALFVDRVCLEWWKTSFGHVCSKYRASTCLGMDIPSAHLSEQYLFDNAGSRSVLPGGSGISNTDLVLYVTANFSHPECASHTLAFAGPCVQDQYGRPIAGTMNICSRLLATEAWKQDVNVILHEMTHVTVMVKHALWSSFKDSSGHTIPLENVVNKTVSPPQIITPHVVSKVREHFNCATATGLPLDPLTAHWNEQHLFSEVMNPITYSQQSYYSQFTLALMEDSGWYAVNYEYAEPYAFGKNAGCSFLSDECIDKSTHTSRFPTYYCHSFSDNGCNADHSVASACYYKEYDSVIPTEYQYFGNPTEGGSSGSNFCPWRHPYSNTAVCWDTSIVGDPNLAKDNEVYGSSSRCTALRDTKSGFDHGHCFEHKCNGWNGSHYAAVDIQFLHNESVRCTRSDIFSAKTLTSVVDRQVICPNIDNLCGTSGSFGGCYWGHYSEIEDECVCSPAYTGTECNTRNDDVDTTSTTTEAVSTRTSMVADVPSSVCFEDWDDYNPAWSGAWSNVETYYDLGTYEKGGRVMYFRASQAQWSIGKDISNAINCYCSVSLYTPNIENCTGNWYCYTGEWAHFPNAKTYSGACDKTTLRGQQGEMTETTHTRIVVGIVLGCVFGVASVAAIVWCLCTVQKTTKLREQSALLVQGTVDDKDSVLETQQIYIPPNDNIN